MEMKPERSDEVEVFHDKGFYYFFFFLALLSFRVALREGCHSSESMWK